MSESQNGSASRFTGLGLRVNASLLTDRETGSTYAVHTGACEKAFDAAMRAAGVEPMARFAQMGPTLLAAGESCNWGNCEVAR